ncbi:MAG: hypothetical protein H8E78_02620 [Proteobacteria bacterium]|nr:hypothetical protein [Pseudomonadota bacterium]
MSKSISRAKRNIACGIFTAALAGVLIAGAANAQTVRVDGTIGSAVASPGDVVQIPISVFSDASTPISGYSFGIAFDTSLVTRISLQHVHGNSQLPGGPDSFFALGLILSLGMLVSLSRLHRAKKA